MHWHVNLIHNIKNYHFSIILFEDIYLFPPCTFPYFIVQYINTETEVINILLALIGVTGVGKSYYKDKIEKELNFEKLKIITNRKPRSGEVNGSDKIFVTTDELNQLVENGEIAFKFNLAGMTYAFPKKEMFSDKNIVFEFHYSELENLKKVCPNVKSLYLLPKDVNIAREKLLERHMDPKLEEARMQDLNEHYEKVTNDKKLLDMFDYVVYNNYDKESDKQVLDIVRELVKIGE